MSKKYNLVLKNFDEHVLTASNAIPVLVEFWAEWCEPCKFMEPILEKLDFEANGSWKFIMVNTELNKEVASEWGIKGVPNLKLFYKGEVIDEVSGAMSEEDLRKWLDEKLPSKAQALTMEAAQLLDLGLTNEGMAKLEAAMDEENTPNQAKLLLAKQKLWKSPEEVFALLEDIKYLESAKEILLMVEAMTLEDNDLKKGASKNKIMEGIVALRKQDMTKTIESLIQAIRVDKPYHEELARKLVVALFHFLGETSEITRTYRRQFDTALFQKV
jgi:putative thioredoxin